MNFKYIAFAVAVLFSISLISACKKPTDPLRADVVKGYATLVYATYSDAHTTAQELQTAVEQFLNAPDSNSLQHAKNAWITARKYYSQTEPFRYYDGPIDNGETGIEPLINAWPLDEVYVDYVEGKPDAGIIHDTANYPQITRELLITLNENGGEENISCGFHAIEFMLWGQDLSAETAGNRPYTDFLPGDNIRERRRTYLRIASALLVEHLQTMTAAWAPDVADNYRATFESDSADISIKKILTGAGVLAKVEMAGERMYTAYDNADQEDEQSCFSDNTLEDLKHNLTGIQNILTGTYQTYSGNQIEVKSIFSLLDAEAPEVSADMHTQLQNVQTAFNTIPSPFDQAIIHDDTRPAVMQAITSIQQLGNGIAAMATALGYSLNIAQTD